MLKIVEVTTQRSYFSSFHVRYRKSFLDVIIIHKDDVENENACEVSSELSAVHNIDMELTIRVDVPQSAKDVVQFVL